MTPSLGSVLKHGVINAQNPLIAALDTVTKDQDLSGFMAFVRAVKFKESKNYQTVEYDIFSLFYLFEFFQIFRRKVPTNLV